MVDFSYRIIADLTHKEAVEEFPSFSLGEDDYEVDYIEESPIDFDALEDYDILFIGNIRHTKDGREDKFSPQELQAIKRFVGLGGGLLITTGEGGDLDIPMKQGSIRVLYKITGVRRFWNGLIQEASGNFLVKKYNVLINELLINHPITKNISELVFPNCTFFTMSDEEVDDIVLTSEKANFKYYVDDEISEIGSVPICAVSEFYNGRCVTIGSSDFLIEDSDYGIDAGDNLKFLENVIQWLNFDI